MIKACEKLFLQMLISGKKVETHVYCEHDTVYFWESYNATTDEVEFSYLVSPKTAVTYEEYVKKLQKECPLLVELF